MTEPPAGTPATDNLTAPKCPNCGAPLELLPDGTCRWCHAMVDQTADGNMAAAKLFFRLADSWDNNWTLTAAPGARHAIPWDMGPSLMTPAKELLAVLAAGVNQPGLVQLAATHGKDPDLDWQFCLIVNDLISAGIEANKHDGPHAYLQVCDLLEALAGIKHTDPQWAAAALAEVGRARSHFWSSWMEAVQGDDPDPFRTELLAWIAAKRKHASGHHFWQR
jgi:hypothetical protein